MQYALIAAFAAVAVALPADDWNNMSTTKEEPKPDTTKWEEAPKPTSKAEWNNYSSKEEHKKVCTTIYVTKECGDKKDQWDNCKDVTKTDTLYDDKCTWAGWDQPPKETWAPVSESKKNEWETMSKDYKSEYKSEYKVCTYVTYYDNVYTTKECGDKKDQWDNCKDVTKTDKKTETKTDENCTGTWGEWYTWKGEEKPKETSWAPAPAAKETWAAASSYPASEKAAESSWAPAPVAKPAASSTAWSPVAKFTGAADKQSFGFGAVAIAAVAMML